MRFRDGASSLLHYYLLYGGSVSEWGGRRGRAPKKENLGKKKLQMMVLSETQSLGKALHRPGVICTVYVWL